MTHRLERFWEDVPTRARPGGASAAPGARLGRIVLAEADPDLRRSLAAALRTDGHDVLELRDGYALLEEAADRIHRHGSLRGVDLIISDVCLPGFSGLHVLAELRSIREAPPVILIAALGDEGAHRVAAALGAARLLDKPFEPEDLRLAVEKVLAR